MPDEINEPIAGPEAIPPKEGRGILKQMAVIAGLGLGGALAFLMVAPPRVSGASRAARLEWTKRRGEIQQAIAAENSREAASRAPATSSSQ